MKRATAILGFLAGVYLLFLGAALASMKMAPRRFAGIAGAVPRFTFRIVPFETLWTRARAGALEPGQPAPDFDLESVDRRSRIRLSAFRGVRPVVLIFGSYT